MSERLPIDRIAIEFEYRVPLWEIAAPPEPRPWTIVLPHGVAGWPEQAHVVTYAGEREAQRIPINTRFETRFTLTRAQPADETPTGDEFIRRYDTPELRGEER